MRLWILLNIGLFSFSLTAESLHGTFRGQILPDTPAIFLSLEEFLQIDLHSDNQFARALEIELHIPQQVLPYRSHLAVFMYKNFIFDSTGFHMAGDRLATEVLPPGIKFYLQVPLIAKAGLKASPDTAVIKLDALPQQAFPLALAISVIDKGEIPTTIQRAVFQVRTRLLNKNLGGINLLTPNLTAEQRKSLKIHVNSIKQTSEGALFLEPGLAVVELSLPGFKDTALNVFVVQARVTDLSVLLEEENPQVLFEAPEGTMIFLDGKKIAWNSLSPLPIEKGIHEVQFVIGSYQVTDNFEIIHGGLHKVSLVMRVQVKE